MGLRIPCGQCKGSGEMPLGSVYMETLLLLRKQKTPLNGAALARLAGCKPTAMANRLARLVKLGLARAEPDGRQTLYYGD